MVKNAYTRVKKSLIAKIQSPDKKIQYQIIQRDDPLINIIFFLPRSDYPSGGVIVAHDHSDTINEINSRTVQSSVMYPADLGFSPKLFSHNSHFKRDFKFDKQKDFVILPEVMVLKFASELSQCGIQYAIHVQNGYLMDLELRSSSKSFFELHNAYQNATLIIGNSDDTIENIAYVFPECKHKILRSYFVIDKHKYKSISEKRNIITYMPRKLAKHSQHLLFFLSDKLPPNWKIMPIDGVKEQEVYDIFTDSKIFLSFSEFEGLAMPPAMAAMSGNKVIGYTGEANKEYFHLPCFEEIPCGDIKLFARKVLDVVERYNLNEELLDIQSIKYLEELFSKKNQVNFLKKLILKVTGSLQY